MKHTKGEWKATANKSFMQVGVYTEEFRFAVNIFLHRIECGDVVSDNFCEENIANAKLIAAAPNLLYSCNELLELLKFHGYEHSTEIYEAKESIKKATE